MMQKTVSIIQMYIILAGLTALMMCSSMFMGPAEAKAAEPKDVEARITELTAKVAVLQSLLAKLLAGATLATTPPAEGEMKGPVIPIGTTFTLTGGILVRADLGGKDTLLGTQATGTMGTIIAGPFKANDRIWYQVDFLTGIDGWCVASGLISKSDVKSLLPAPVRLATTTEKEGLKDQVGVTAKLEYLRTKLASTTSPIAQQKITELINKLLQQQASNTKATSTPDRLRKPRLHQASSTPEQSESVPSDETSGGSVLGASTDIYAEIAQTLTGISATLSTLK